MFRGAVFFPVTVYTSMLRLFNRSLWSLAEWLVISEPVNPLCLRPVGWLVGGLPSTDVLLAVGVKRWWLKSKEIKEDAGMARGRDQFRFCWLDAGSGVTYLTARRITSTSRNFWSLTVQIIRGTSTLMSTNWRKYRTRTSAVRSLSTSCRRTLRSKVIGSRALQIFYSWFAWISEPSFYALCFSFLYLFLLVFFWSRG